MSPADDYVARFVKGYNRAQIVKCHDLVQPGVSSNNISVPATMCLTQAIQILGRGGVNCANVVDNTGAHCGTISLQQMVEFL
jgi:ABC-type proline/glycine betaine transport system ATPase subunit